MTYEERQKFKRLKQEMEHAIYNNIIESIMTVSQSYEKLATKEQLEVIMLISKIKDLDNKYSA
tara:strand:- start:76 stop:264 length:189 start_codon:yes stop_codon:yes gene_type:complete